MSAFCLLTSPSALCLHHIPNENPETTLSIPGPLQAVGGGGLRLDDRLRRYADSDGGALPAAIRRRADRAGQARAAADAHLPRTGRTRPGPDDHPGARSSGEPARLDCTYGWRRHPARRQLVDDQTTRRQSAHGVVVALHPLPHPLRNVVLFRVCLPEGRALDGARLARSVV